MFKSPIGLLAGALILAAAGVATADVSLTDQRLLGRQIKAQSKADDPRHKPGQPGGPNRHPSATGSQALIDASGLQWFINDNITFSTTSSASGAASEASYTAPVMASTSAGGVTSSTLNDSFDGYGTLCVSLTNATGPCQTGNANFTIYNQNGGASTLEGNGRQVDFPAKTIGGLSVTRKVFVSATDSFARWQNVFTNTTAAPITFTVISGNNLGSDSNTRVVTTSSGDATATPADLWVTSFQNFSGNTSSDPRLGHILQGAGAPVPLAGINFVDGDDNPYWSYSVTLAAGQTGILLNFATGQPSKAAAATQAAALAALPAGALEFMTSTEQGQVLNFLLVTPTVTTPTSTAITTTTATLGGDVTADGGSLITERGIVFSATSANADPLIGGAGVTKVTAAGTTGVFTAPASGLVAATAYSFKAYATNAIGTSYTSVASLVTPTVPTVIAPTSASVTTTTAILGGNVSSDGNSAITERGVVYAATAVNADPLIGGGGVTKVTTVGTTGVFTVPAGALQPATAYSFKAYAINAIGTSYTSVATFTTAGLLPGAVTVGSTGVTVGGAILSGLVTPGGLSTTAVFNYGLTTSYGSQIAATPPPGSGTLPVSVSATLTGLTCGSTYHFQVSATNSVGTTNGADSSFTTGACVGLAIDDPSILEGNQGWSILAFTVTLSTVSATDVTLDYATSNGTATSGSDYNAASRSFTIPAGVISKRLVVLVAGDTGVEPDETVLVTLGNAVGAPIGKAVGTGTILNDDAPAAAALVNFYRLYSSDTQEHLYTTDANEYAVLATRGWTQEGVIGKVLSDGLFSGSQLVPLFRLYQPSSRQHLWTTDSNEVNVLSPFINWYYEGTIGYLLPTQVGGSVPLYRMNLPFQPLHLLTTDLNEYNTLVNQGWVQEGIVGYIIP